MFKQLTETCGLDHHGSLVYFRYFWNTEIEQVLLTLTQNFLTSMSLFSKP